MLFKISQTISLILFCIISSTKSESCPALVTNVHITCDGVIYAAHRVVGETLTCYDNGLISVVSRLPDSRVVAPVNFRNGTEVKNIADIEALWIYYGNVRFIPKGISNIFRNLRVLAIEISGILAINRENFKEFGNKLEFVSFYQNSITSIDENVFDYNPNLRHIYLADNPIKYIDSRFFENLKILSRIEYVSLEGQDCINQVYDRKKHGDISSFKWKDNKCTNENGKIESMLWPIYGRSQHSLENENCLNENLETIIKRNKKFENVALARIEKIEDDLKSLMQMIEQLTKITKCNVAKCNK